MLVQSIILIVWLVSATIGTITSLNALVVKNKVSDRVFYLAFFVSVAWLVLIWWAGISFLLLV